jgi:predicted nucleic acid-binding protein
MKSLVFLDSGIFIAFLNRRDQWHTQAHTLFNQDKPRWATSLLVVSETYSWFLHRMGEEAARKFKQLLKKLEKLKLYEISSQHHVSVTKMLDQFHGSKLSYVDASSLCFLKQHKIKQVWSTDHHLGLTGIPVLPRK